MTAVITVTDLKTVSRRIVVFLWAWSFLVAWLGGLYSICIGGVLTTEFISVYESSRIIS